jgi:uncharacterized protein
VKIPAIAFLTVLLGLGVLVYRSFMTLSLFQTFSVMVISVVLEALPFLLLGSLAAAVVRVVVPVGALKGVARRLGPLGIPLAALSGVVAPVCECAIVPTVSGLRRQGLSLSYSMTLVVAVPLLNPVVLLSTLAAFPGRPGLVAARFVGGFLVAVLVGTVFYLVREVPEMPDEPGTGAGPVPAAGRIDTVVVTDRKKVGAGEGMSRIVNGTFQEFLEIFGYFIVGAVAAALVQLLLRPEHLPAGMTGPVVSMAIMILLAYVLSVCSEADAFIAKAFLPIFGVSGALAFMIFGPMLDLKNTVMLGSLLSTQQILLLAGLLVVAVPGVVFGLSLGGFL